MENQGGKSCLNSWIHKYWNWAFDIISDQIYRTPEITSYCLLIATFISVGH